MFERYTEKARRVIFFARYEASQFGLPYIETEHLLLGLLREDKALTNRFLHSHSSVESIRKQVEAHTTIREKVSTSVDLPLSNESKRVLAYAAEEAERMGHKHIGTEHLLLGLLREGQSFAANLLKERGIELDKVREGLARVAHVPEQPASPGSASPVAFSQDLTQAAIDKSLEPVIGRESELDALIEVLASFRKGSALLVGEPGAGKCAIVSALAQRIALGDVPPFLAEKRILLIDPHLTAPASLAGLQSLREKLPAAQKTIPENEETILFVGDLGSLLAPPSFLFPWGPGRVLRQSPLQGKVRCIASATPGELERCLRESPWISDLFRPIHVRPFNEAETLEVLKARKQFYEEFHQVAYSDEALELAANASSRYLHDRVLPGKALELIDAAGARAKLRQAVVAPEVAELQKRIRFIVHRMDSSIQNHEFEKARFYSDEERKERENLLLLLKNAGAEETPSASITPPDIEEVIARWSEYPFRP
ncbi:MAG: Clp protease N-terminal domain-containing protein [Terracidiphilus sp.]